MLIEWTYSKKTASVFSLTNVDAQPLMNNPGGNEIFCVHFDFDSQGSTCFWCPGAFCLDKNRFQETLNGVRTYVHTVKILVSSLWKH